jgi:hypothetical protein
MSLSKITLLEAILEEEGHDELLKACKSIVGSDGSESGMGISINEDGMKETMGTWKVYWLKYKIIILENVTLFNDKCNEVGLSPDKLIYELTNDIEKVEAIL